MLIAGSALKGYAIEASDGRIGTVKTLLFDDTTWKIRWLVIDTGNWLSGRLVLVHPSVIGTPDHEGQHLPVRLSKAQVEASPDIEQDRPVTMQMQSDLYSYYGWDPYWGPNFYGPVGFGIAPVASFDRGGTYPGEDAAREAVQMGCDDGDPHLRDMAALRGYHIHATDGTIGHVENFMLDDADWAIRYLIVDTRNWWPGEHVLIAPYAVKDIHWGDQEVRLNVTRDQVKTSPKWDPAELVEHVYERRLHHHYGWPGYGW
jgi:sporulation protein YlmC with PRC-barrel domain